MLAADRRNLVLVMAQAPVLGLLMLVALPGGELAPAPASQLRLISQASLVLLVIVLGVTWLGMSNAVREIAKELPIFRRERAAGPSISAYVASKATMLGAITILQSAVLVALATADQGGPVYASVLGWPLGELMIGAVLAGLAAMCIGLLISALARTSDRATTVLPVVLVFQLVLALGGVFPQIGNKPVLKQLGYVSSARWGSPRVASTTDLNNLQALTGVLTRTPSVNLQQSGAAVHGPVQRRSRRSELGPHRGGLVEGRPGAPGDRRRCAGRHGPRPCGAWIRGAELAERRRYARRPIRYRASAPRSSVRRARRLWQRRRRWRRSRRSVRSAPPPACRGRRSPTRSPAHARSGVGQRLRAPGRRAAWTPSWPR